MSDDEMLSPGKPSLIRLATHNALWAGASLYVSFGIGFVKMIVLTRLIGVEYFGLLAVATVWASYLTVLRLDLRLAVLSSREEPAVLNTQFLLQGVSSLTGLILAGFLYWVRPGILPQPVAWPIIFTLLIVSVFEAFTSTPMYLVEKRLRQDVLGRLTVLTALVGFCVPVLLALAGMPLAAVLIDAVLPVLIVRTGVALFVRWRPTASWDGRQIRDQLRLGWTLLTAGVMNRIIFQFDDMLVGNLVRPNPVPWLAAGVEPEGYYSRAYDVGKMPMDVAAGMIGQIALSLYAEGAARGREVLRKAYRQLTWLLAWIIFASSAVAFVAAGEIVRLLLTDRWLPMVPLFRLMFLFVVGRPLFQNNAQLLQAVRAEGDFHRTTILQALFILAACPVAVYFWGAAGAAVAISGMTVIGFLTTEGYVAKHLGVAVWRCYLVPAAACAVAIAGAMLIGPAVESNVWISALVKISLCGIVFAAALALFERHSLRENWQLLRQGLGWKHSSPG